MRLDFQRLRSPSGARPICGGLALAMLLAVFPMARHAWADVALAGQPGLINMPDGRLSPDGTLRTGIYFAKPYSGFYAGVTALPFLDATLRYNRIMYVPAFSSPYGAGFGDYKDKILDLKLRLIEEGERLPALAIGVTDVVGTGLFSGEYLAASKRFGEADLTVGFARGPVDGVFGGVRYRPQRWDGFGVVAEYDASDYRAHPFSRRTGIATRKKGPAFALEYQWEWIGTQLAWQREEAGLHAYVAIPLDRRAFIPKIHEPEPFVGVVPRPSERQWNDEPLHRERVLAELLADDFRNVAVDYRDGTLQARLTNSRVSSVPRAVGRAARILVAMAPLETQRIVITYDVRDIPVVTYRFEDLESLQNYFVGNIPRSRLAPKVAIDYADASGEFLPQGRRSDEDREAALAAAVQKPLTLRLSDEGVPVTLRSEDARQNRAGIRPSADIFFNDPSGAFRYGIHLLGTLERRIAPALWLDGELRLTVLEDISDVTQASNSQLPHVRTDVAEYYRASSFRLNKLVASNYFQLAPGDYGRLSAGIYEEMFAGAGGQWLHLFRRSPLAIDVAVDWLRQRDVNGWFSFRDYRTVTAVASLHYQLPLGVRATVRGGRFLARDQGARFELKRRFRSGMEIGAWYTVTDGRDETPPGAPGKPYFDKGVFFMMPFGPLLTRDTQGFRSMSISPWTRDVGQMVRSPGDLYGFVERPLFHELRGSDGLSGFGDVDDDYALPALGDGGRRGPLF
jgi:hypothetical protein